MIRRFGEAIQRDVKYRLRPGAYVILPRNGQVLLTFQESPKAEFQLPGGGVDKGENPIAALHREVFEETGWTIGQPMRLGAYRRFCYMPDYDLWAEKLCTIYVARPILRISDPTEPGHTAVWMSHESALSVLANVGDQAYLAGL